MEQPTGSQTSEFNMSISYLYALRVILNKCVETSMTLDAAGWLHSLAALYRELSTEIKPEDRQSFETELDNLCRRILTNKNPLAKFPKDLYFQLHAYEIKLRDVMKTKGLLLKMSQDPSKAIYG